MKPKTVILLGLIAAILLVFFVLGDNSSNESVSEPVYSLASDINPDTIAGFEISSGGKSAHIGVRDEKWVLEDRENYPADISKVRAFLFKILGLVVTEVVSSDRETYQGFQVADDVFSMRVRLFGENGDVLKELFFGDVKKDKTPLGEERIVGQYVRVSGGVNVYLLRQPLEFYPEVSAWLENQVLNVLSTEIKSVAQISFQGNSSSELYRLHKTEADRFEFRCESFALNCEKLSDEAQALVVSGLDNLRISDVLPQGDSSIAFDMETRYELLDGRKVTVQSAKKNDNYYIHISVTRAKKSEEATSDRELRFESWDFVVPEYIGKKFRQVGSK